MKIGRNQSCPCGSGKKYKKCHLGKPMDAMIAKMIQKESYQQDGLLIGRPMIATEFKGKKVVAVGSSRLYHNLAPNIIFHEFIIVFLKDILGLPWGLTESQKPHEDQHIIVQWIIEMGELFRTVPNQVENPDKDIKSIESSGNVQALLSLAYDIYSIYHCAELPEELINRLKNNDQFQGAKYEIAVGGIFVRAGFNIVWHERSARKQGEFIATHRDTGETITVEAKSRHRVGVLNRPGQTPQLEMIRAQIGRLFNKALEKPDEGNPFMIFVDVNLPLTEGANTLQKRWVNDIKKMLDQHPKGTFEHPDPFTVLFVTNFSWHYHGSDTSLRQAETLIIIPLFPKIRVHTQDTITLLHKATEQYGAVPAMFPKREII